jgi:hypothetical protein
MQNLFIKLELKGTLIKLSYLMKESYLKQVNKKSKSFGNILQSIIFNSCKLFGNFFLIKWSKLTID